MRKYILLILLATLWSITACKTSKYAESRVLLKEYAFCQCLQYAGNYVSGDISKSVYRDIAHYDLGVYDKIDSISRIKAMNILPSPIADHKGKKAVLLDCFRYYNSVQLDSLVKKMGNRIIKSW